MLAATYALWKREIVKFIRDRSRLVGALLQPLGFWVLLGLGFSSTFTLPGLGEAGVSYFEYLFPGIIALVLLFTAIFSTISVVEERQSGFLQAVLVSPQPRASIVFGTVFGGTTLATVQAMMFLLLAPLVGFSPGLLGVGVVLLASVLTALAFTALGFIIAWRLDTTRGFHAVMNLFLLPLWFVSGAFFPAEGAPAVLRALMVINPAYYGVAAIRHGLYGLGEVPGVRAGLISALSASAVFAVVMIGIAIVMIRRPLYGSGA